jgi:23S rRNA (cytidine1920-2'-O)/16S rRNA (cytidine1409-2'-O)-methyltransferase
VQRGLASTRSQAENYIKLGYAQVDGQTVTKPGASVTATSQIALTLKEKYVSRAALKLDSAADKLGLDFKKRVILDVGSSTGGFTDYALRHGAAEVIAVEVGADQLHPSLREDKRIELHERTDIRKMPQLSAKVDIVLIDVSFISLREVLPAIADLVGPKAQIVAMAKPQFEAGAKDVHKGVVKNEAMRRNILKDFEAWAKKSFIVGGKADSAIAGTKGNIERFYLLTPGPER